MLTTRDFSVGDKVRFGRGRGEQTLGTVVKVNSKTLKVRQDESRGTQRAYPVGTVWTVGPTYCTKLSGTVTPKAPTSRPQTPRDILAAKGIQAGDVVEFTFRTVDGICTGTITSINVKRVSIEQVSTERERLAPKTFTSPKYPRGVYCNPGDIIRKVGTAPAKLGIGQTVEFQGYSWAARGTATIQGVITKTTPSKGRYEVYGEGRFHDLSAADVKAVSNRDDATIVSECCGVYGSLSPENLTCDGELSRTQVRDKYARLQRALKALFREAGREITESETWKAWEAQRASK